MKLTDTIRQMIAGTPVDKKKLLAAAEHQEHLLHESRELLDQLYTQVGLHHGQQIKALTAKFTGQRFNEKEYLYDRNPDGQE